METDLVNDIPELLRERLSNYDGELIGRRLIPVIDLKDFSSRRKKVEEELWEVCTNVGFFQLKNHGIPLDKINAAFLFLDKFFSLSEDIKKKYPLSNNCGWEYRKQVRPSTGAPDRKESYQITKNIMGKLWPEMDLPEISEVMLELENLSWTVGMQVLSCFTRRLELPGDFFSIAHDPDSSEYQSTLRLLRYFGGTDAARSKEWGAGAHTDYNCLTLVFQTEGEDGLEVCPGKEYSSGSWTPVSSTPVELITCNIGDMLMRWSDDRLVSNFHRVRTPPPGKKRDSIAFFCQANRDIMIRSRLHGEMNAGEYLRKRVSANFGEKAFDM